MYTKYLDCLVVLRYVLQKQFLFSLKKSHGRIKLSKKSACVIVVGRQLAIIKITVRYIIFTESVPIILSCF